MTTTYKAIHDYGDNECVATGHTPEAAVEALTAIIDAEYEQNHGHPPPIHSEPLVVRGTKIVLGGIEVGRVDRLVS